MDPPAVGPADRPGIPGPLIWFWATGRIERRLRPRLALLFVLGGLQGAVGWFMVASGFLPDTTAVSPYRLVIHLALALVLYVALLWTGLSVLRPLPPAPRRRARCCTGMAGICCALVALTIVAGGFVAGTHAGFDLQHVPADGRPAGAGRLRALQPFWRNLTENIAAVQFDHRLLATLTVAGGRSATLVIGLRRPASPARRASPLLAFGAAVVVQYVPRRCDFAAGRARSPWRPCTRPLPCCC